MTRERSIPEATVGRLPVYLRALVETAGSGTATVSSEELAEAAGVNSAKVRKDLSHLGSYGTRGVGYDVAYLIHQIRRELGLTQDWAIVIAGIGNLGHALANYRGFAERGFRIAALVDEDPAKVGERVGELTIRHVDELPGLVSEFDIAIGVIATPAGAVQEVADRLVDGGHPLDPELRSRDDRAGARASRCARLTWRWSCRSWRSTNNARRRSRRSRSEAARWPNWVDPSGPFRATWRSRSRARPGPRGS